MTTKQILPIVAVLVLCCSTMALDQFDGDSVAAKDEKPFLAGAAQVDITPLELPVIVSGSFLERTADTVRDRLYARALVFDDGTSRAAICIVDSLFMPSDLLGEAKRRVAKQTDIRVEDILVSATHTHTAPSVAGALGTGVDESYREFLPGKIAEAIMRANDKLEPAKIGWTAIDAPNHTHCRRWILRPDKIQADVFGQPTVRANMHPGYQNPDFIGPAGPVDSELSMLAVQSHQGRPLAVLANYSMHYFGSSQVSADYFGRFVDRFTALIGATQVKPRFVAVMSQGTSGDLHWMDYSKARRSVSLDSYSEELAGLAAEAYKGIDYRDSCSLGMLERTLRLQRRVPDEARLSWARHMAEKMQGQKPRSRPEVYALEQIHLHEEQVRELKLQVLRIGELGIVAIPCEVYGITGLKIKAQSPLAHTFNIELANGSEGYIPPPEQHGLGGYTTWPARSAGLEVGAEPRIVETLLSMLEDASDRKRRIWAPVLSAYDRAVLKSQPLAYWRLNEIQGSRAADSTGNGNHAAYKDGVALYLPGPGGPGHSVNGCPSRSVHLAGGRIETGAMRLGRRYSVEMWIWNGLPADVRPFTGLIFSCVSNDQGDIYFDQLGIGGTFGDSVAQGKLIFAADDLQEGLLTGRSELPLRTWQHVALVRGPRQVQVYVNGKETPEIDTSVKEAQVPEIQRLVIGGGGDKSFSFEGRIAKLAVFKRLLSGKEISSHYQAGATGPKSE